MTNQIDALEFAVLEKVLDGGLPPLPQLRSQLSFCTVTERQLTGCGFFTTIAVPDDVEKTPGLTFMFGDVNADIPGLARGAGFLLYVKDGLLDLLEGYCYEES